MQTEIKCTLATLAALALWSAGAQTNLQSTPSTSTGNTPLRVLCDYAYSAFNPSPSVNAVSTATWSCDGATRQLKANGLPDHEVGSFPNRNNPPAMAAQNVAVSMPLNPVLSGNVRKISGPRTDTGFLLNGVKIDPSTAAACDDSGSACTMARGTGAWSIEAMGQKTFNFGTDSNNAHVQPGGAYHYHGMPEGFIAKIGKGKAMTLIGWATDGFPIYARYGYSTASDPGSALKTIQASYRLKPSPSAGRPSTSTYPMGTFTQDYEYVAGSGDLDECNGRTGVTPEFPQGIYHYFATDTYPYLQRCTKGKL
jgi:hypothetical protein